MVDQRGDAACCVDEVGSEDLEGRGCRQAVGRGVGGFGLGGAFICGQEEAGDECDRIERK
jgi:hypothetical protein